MSERNPVLSYGEPLFQCTLVFYQLCKVHCTHHSQSDSRVPKAYQRPLVPKYWLWWLIWLDEICPRNLTILILVQKSHFVLAFILFYLQERRHFTFCLETWGIVILPLIPCSTVTLTVCYTKISCTTATRIFLLASVTSAVSQFTIVWCLQTVYNELCKKCKENINSLCSQWKWWKINWSSTGNFIVIFQ